MIYLFRWLLGWVSFSITGSCGAWLTKAGSRVWKVKKENGVVYACCLAGSYPYLLERAQDCKCQLEIQKRAGLPVILKRYRLRIGLLVGLCLAIAVILISGMFVWRVDVHGNLDIPTTDLLEKASEYGLHSGTFIHSIKAQEIEYQLQSSFDKIAWISINRNGTNFTIEISEVTPKPEQLNASDPCNVAAAYDGIILSIEPYAGFTLVKAGDVVKKDDLLVSGIKEIEESGQVLYAHSKAKVVAQVEREQSFVRPTTDIRAEKTGERQTIRKLNLFGLKIPFGFGSKPEEPYEESISTQPVDILGIRLPFTMETHTYDIIDQNVVQNDIDQMKRLLADDARQWEQEQLVGAKILNRSFTFDATQDNITLHAVYTVEQRIDEQRPIIIQNS